MTPSYHAGWLLYYPYYYINYISNKKPKIKIYKNNNNFYIIYNFFNINFYHKSYRIAIILDNLSNIWYGKISAQAVWPKMFFKTVWHHASSSLNRRLIFKHVNILHPQKHGMLWKFLTLTGYWVMISFFFYNSQIEKH